MENSRALQSAGARENARFTTSVMLGVLIVLLFGAVVETTAQDDGASQDTVTFLSQLSNPNAGPYFYRGLSYGSEAFMGPLDVILNKGFALAQIDAVDRRIFEFPYGYESVVHALTHPQEAIDRGGGWWQFIRKEILPLSYKFGDIKWYTNYTGHMIEGGIHWRRLAEWYQARGVPAPRFLAGVTTTMAAVLNEFYEHPVPVRAGAGAVADLYLFDIAGILLFSSDGVSRFFVRKLHANVWPGQASLTVPSGEVHNNAAYLTFKFPLSVVSNSSVFFWTGIGAGLGMTFHRSGGLDFSFALGHDAKHRFVDQETGEETAELTPSGVLFVDRNGSVLASVHVSQVKHRLLKLNLYPGVIGGAGRSFGAWGVLSHDGKVRLGITNRHWLGTGIGWSR